MRKPNNKLFKAMMLSGLAFVALCSFKASAQDIFICTSRAGHVSYQDKPCARDEVMQQISIDINQSAEIDAGLRPYEKVVLARAFERQMLEKILAART